MNKDLILFLLVVLLASLIPAAAQQVSQPAGFSVLGDHGPGEWTDMDIPAGWTSDREGDGWRISSVVNTIMPRLKPEDQQRGYLSWAVGTPEFEKAYIQAVRQWESYCQQKGWPPFAYQPHDEIDASAERTKEGGMFLSMLRRCKVKTFMTYIGSENRRKETLPLVDIAVYAGDAFRAEFATESHKARRSLGVYSGSAT